MAQSICSFSSLGEKTNRAGVRGSGDRGGSGFHVAGYLCIDRGHAHQGRMRVARLAELRRNPDRVYLLVSMN